MDTFLAPGQPSTSQIQFCSVFLTARLSFRPVLRCDAFRRGTLPNFSTRQRVNRTAAWIDSIDTSSRLYDCRFYLSCKRDRGYPPRICTPRAPCLAIGSRVWSRREEKWALEDKEMEEAAEQEAKKASERQREMQRRMNPGTVQDFEVLWTVADNRKCRWYGGKCW